MIATQPALASDRLRMLALMDIDVYVRRVRGEPLPIAIDATITSRPLPLAAVAAVRDTRAPTAPRSAEPLPARVVFATGTDGGFDGRHGALLRSIALGLGLDPRAVVCGSPREGLPCVCFGAAPGTAIDVVLAPPLASLRGSAATRRALWASLRPLARLLGS